MSNESKANTPGAPQAASEHETAPEQKPISPRKALVGVAIVLIVAAAVRGFLRVRS